MNRAQQAVLKGTILGIIVMLCVPPFAVQGGYGVTMFKGYHLIWEPEPENYWIDLSRLLLQIVTLYVVIAPVMVLSRGTEDAKWNTIIAKLPAWLARFL